MVNVKSDFRLLLTGGAGAGRGTCGAGRWGWADAFCVNGFSWLTDSSTAFRSLSSIESAAKGSVADREQQYGSLGMKM